MSKASGQRATPAKQITSTKVVISVSGGVVNAVCTDSPGVEVYLADFDELKADPKADCSIPYPVDSLGDFRSAVKTLVNRYRGIKNLITSYHTNRRVKIRTSFY